MLAGNAKRRFKKRKNLIYNFDLLQKTDSALINENENVIVFNGNLSLFFYFVGLNCDGNFFLFSSCLIVFIFYVSTSVFP